MLTKAPFLNFLAIQLTSSPKIVIYNFEMCLQTQLCFAELKNTKPPFK